HCPHHHSLPTRRSSDLQITYPLTTSLLGLPGVTSVRSSSAFGFSSIYIIFNEDIEFYWSRSRVLKSLLPCLPVSFPRGYSQSLRSEEHTSELQSREKLV